MSAYWTDKLNIESITSFDLILLSVAVKSLKALSLKYSGLAVRSE
jgi:hypothetical protein